MKKKLSVGLVVLTYILGTTGATFGAIIDFAGGTAKLTNNTTVTTTNTGLWEDTVDYYEEDGIKVDFIDGAGTIGDYYSTGQGTGSFTGPPYENSIIHAHWYLEGSGIGDVTSIRFTKSDGSSFDLNYVDITSNTAVGGGQSTGNEDSYITTSGGHSMLLPSSAWGFDYDWYGSGGDGVSRLWLDDNFDGITSFTLTSTNASCFGMDNFYIDEPPPPVPVPAAVLLGGIGLAVSGWKLRKRGEL